MACGERLSPSTLLSCSNPQATFAATRFGREPVPGITAGFPFRHCWCRTCEPRDPGHLFPPKRWAGSARKMLRFQQARGPGGPMPASHRCGSAYSARPSRWDTVSNGPGVLYANELPTYARVSKSAVVAPAALRQASSKVVQLPGSRMFLAVRQPSWISPGVGGQAGSYLHQELGLRKGSCVCCWRVSLGPP